MKSAYKTSANYYKVLNKKIPVNQKIYRNIQTDPNYFNHDFRSKNTNYLSFNEEDNIYLFLSKELSKKKKRGILDISSPGNKDVLTDSDSELPPSKKSKTKGFINKNKDKKGCAKLIIEKVESQVPKRNEEYYKFTNQKRNLKGLDLTNINNKYKLNKLIGFNNTPKKLEQNSFNNKLFKSINNKKNAMTQNRGFTNPKGYQDTNKIMEKKNIPKNNYISSNFKKINYNKNRILISDPTSKEKNYFLNENNLNKNNYTNNNKNGKIYIGFKINRSPINYKSSETSIDRDYKSLNYLQLQNSNKKNSGIIRNEFSTPVPSYTNDDDTYSNKKALNLKKNIALNSKPIKTISLYNNYDNLAKRPTINQLINLNYNTKSQKTYIQNKFNEKLIKSITKIQSYWRGYFIRELMAFVEKLNKFIETLYKLFKNNKKKNFFYFLNFLKNLEKPKKKQISVGLNMRGPTIRQKYLFNKVKNDKKDLNDNLNKPRNSEESIKTQIKIKDDDNNYLNLLKNYNSLMDKYNNLLEEMNNMKKNDKFENLDIDKNELDIIVKKMIKNDKKRKSKENKNEIIQNIDYCKNKKFDLIKPEQNEGFIIIQKSNDNNSKFREKKNSKMKIEQIEKVSEIEFQREKDNNLNLNYDYVLGHFKSNINISNNEQFIIKESPNISKKINAVPFYISNNSLTLINKKSSKEKKRQNDKDKQNIVEEKSKSPKIFNNISINKDKESEISIIIVKKEKKKKKSSKRVKKQNLELIEESQTNLNTEIKGLEYNDDIQIKKPKEFNNEQLLQKNDILLNIISEDKPQKEIDTNNIKDNNNFNNESLAFDNKINISILSNIQIDKNDEKKDSKEINNDFIEEKSKEKNLKEILMIDNNNILYIKKIKKRKFDKMTEITEELNKIEPNNHYELIFKGKIDLNENLGAVKIENKEGNNKNSDKNENEKALNEENEEKQEEKKNKINYNEENEIDKGNGLEINPLELKKDKTPNNVIISYENNIEVLYNKNATFTDKAKKNMMKIILPIRLKTTLREYVRKRICPLLIKRLKVKK